jgi:hypothetical protein
MKAERRLMGDRIREAAEKAEHKGIVCPACACVQFGEGKHVRNTVPVEGGVRRYRTCRNCGHSWPTFEQ